MAIAEINVLLVEDSQAYAMLVSSHLRQDRRFALTHVTSLSDAITAVSHDFQTDVVILDLNLPDSAGFETFTALHQKFPETPIVILSGQEEENLATNALAEGAQDYVPKTSVNGPLLVRSLLYAIERNGRHVAERRNGAIEYDLATARRIQAHLLPEESPSLSGFDIAGVCLAAESWAGDFFDYIKLPNGKWDLLIADVSGHGFAPALIMVGTRRILRTCALMHNDVGDILSVANHAVMDDTLPEQFVTLFYARLDPASQTMTYSSAGHPAWIIRANDVTEALDCDNIPLGMMPETKYAAESVSPLLPGDILVMMTDGVWESISPSGQRFRKERVFEIIRQNRRSPADEIVDLILEALGEFCHPGKLEDDVTVVLSKVIDSVSR